MPKKRGMSVVWSQLLSIIIGIVVVIGVADILFGGKLFRNTQEAMKDLWNYTRFGAKDFVPYKEQLATEEQMVDRSVRALVFAIEKVANPDAVKPADIPNCGKRAEPEGVCCETTSQTMVGMEIADIYKYENVPPERCSGGGKRIVEPTFERCPELHGEELCIDCENPSRKCVVKNFDLPQEGADDNWIKSASDPKYILFYESFPPYEDKSWQISRFDLSAEWMIISGAVNVVGPFFTVFKSGLKNTIRSSWNVVKSNSAEAFGKVASKASSKELLGEAGESGILRFFRKARNFIFKSGLTNQEILIKNLIMDNFYYRFGRGADEVLDIIDMDSIIKGAKGKSLEEVNGIVQRQLNTPRVKDIFSWRFMDEKGFVRSFNTLEDFRQFYENTPNRQLLDWLLAERNVLEARGYRSLNEITDTELRKSLEKDVSDLAYDYSKKSYEELQKTLLERSKQELTESAMNNLASDMADDVFFLSSLGERELKMVRARRSLMYNLLKEGRQIDDDLLRKMIDDSIKLMENIPPGVERKVKQSLFESALADVNKVTGSIDFGKIFGREFSRDIAEDLDRQFLRIMQEKASILDQFYVKDSGTIIQTMLRGAARNTFGFSPGFTGLAKDTVPIRWGLLKTGGAIITWPFKHRYLGLVLLTLYAQNIEGRNEKFLAHGIDTMVLTQPFYFEQKREYDLTAGVGDDFILLKKDRGVIDNPDSQRFYLVSPCKADLEVSKSMCSCTIPNGAHVLSYDYRTNKIYQPIDQDTAQKSDNPNVPIQHYEFFDNLNERDKDETRFSCVRDCNDILIAFYLDKFIEYVHNKIKSDSKYENYFKNVNNRIKFFDGDRLKPKEEIITEIRWMDPDWLRWEIQVMIYIHEKSFYHSTYKSAGWSGYWFGELTDNPLFEDFFNEGSLMWQITREKYYFHFTEYPKSNSDYKMVIKECSDFRLSQSPYEPLQPTRGGFFSSYMYATSALPCIIIKPTLDPSYDPNFCYEGSKDVQRFLRGVNMAFWIGVDAYVAGQTLGTGLILLPITGVIQEAGDQWIIRVTGRWPSH